MILMSFFDEVVDEWSLVIVSSSLKKIVSGEDGGYELMLRRLGKRRHEIVASSALYVDPTVWVSRGSVSDSGERPCIGAELVA
jgi:hypothetical protein